jgi:hypothetical protein
MTAAADQNAILQYLYRRISGGDARYCTISTIRKNSGVQGSNQYVLALTDDLETAGYVITRQAYQVSGGRLFQITAAGIDLVDRGEAPNRADSAAWTGRFNLTENQKAEIRKILRQMRDVISAAKLSNARTANAIALVECAEKLVETPDPLWPEIMRLLRSPTLSGVTGIAGLIVGIVGILMAAASS